MDQNTIASKTYTFVPRKTNLKNLNLQWFTTNFLLLIKWFLNSSDFSQDFWIISDDWFVDLKTSGNSK